MKLKQKTWQSLLAGVIISLVVLLLSILVHEMGILETVELKTIDYRFKRRGHIEDIPVRSPIVIVALDQESWESIPYRYPYPRKMWAKVVQNLKEAGAKLIVFDVQFDTYDINDLPGDTLFAETMKKAGNVILPSKLTQVIVHGQTVEYITQPVDLFYNACITTGLIGELKDIDQYTRNYSIFYPYNNTYYLFLGIKAIKEYLGIHDSVKMSFSQDSKFIKYGPLQIRHNNDNSFMINYYGPAKTFSTYSLASVLDDSDIDLLGDYDTDYMELWKGENSSFPHELLSILNPTGEDSPFKDKIVLIGDALEEHFDTKFTPFYSYQGRTSLMAGVETHAHAMQTILDNNYLIKPDKWVTYCIVIGLSILALIAIITLGPLLGILLTAILIVIYSFLSFHLFEEYQIIAELVIPILAIFLSYALDMLYEFVLEQREKKKIRGMFSTYISPKILKYLEDHPDAFSLTGEKREATIFFSDVQNFTALSERLSPEDLATLLNKYLSPMTQILMSYDGYVDKYEGDAIMCDFGVPIEDAEHAKKACWAALDQQKKLAELRPLLKKEYGVELYVRMGINSGSVSAGNMGSEQRFQYTVLGDTVNAASRFESANKQYGTYLMIGESTYQLAKDFIEARMLDRLIVHGKAQPITVYHLIAKKGEASDAERLLIEWFEKGLTLYWNRQWDDAITAFQKALHAVPHDPLSELFIQRCLAFKNNPPPDQWQGEFLMTTK
ncbi:MAG: adenylate/guanylate cyclase domain-containing protein [Candidatus Marinimicrobia bacterium]|nr:adenylate/guanylate cyclase domain-containing protein [Candidatus Neomarinimicrobiota bacterium]